ncbi:hypothetical protein QBC34DRAFT_224119 [Podospora aff. communis PSN243]|uniref:Uncharacterized protein n=1 Tax=Podospora aff. communis PSN243 TaxID=3040156 RepID=A0AAV9G3Y0_9PEZI|nr:hypothetical protein QBC34DRAFT_224119 [Podospora aff. communis PSN243]
MAFSEVNCSEYRALEANPDIAGPGVFAGFLGTAWLAITLLLAYYFLAFDPGLDPFWIGPANDPEARVSRPNPVDMSFYRLRSSITQVVSKYMRASKRQEMSQRLSIIFSQAVMTMSDLQIISGMAVLVSGYATLPQAMSVYHWKIILRLGWFSTITHLAALTCLRTYLFRNPSKRIVRLFFMAFLALILLTGMLFTGRINLDPEQYAICYFRLDFDRVPVRYSLQDTSSMASPLVALPVETTQSSFSPEMLMSCLLLIHNIFVRTLKLHPWRRNGLLARLSRKLLWCFANGIRKATPDAKEPACTGSIFHVAYHVLIIQPFVAFLTVLNASILVYLSVVSEVYALLVAAAWGTLHLYNKQKVFENDEESSWEYGQVINVMIFLTPLITLSDQFVDIKMLVTDMFVEVNGQRANQTLRASPETAVSPVSFEGERTQLPSGKYHDGLDATSPVSIFITVTETSTHSPTQRTLTESTASFPAESRIDRVNALEKMTFSAISVAPVLAYAEEEASDLPLLGEVEKSPWFLPLVLMLAAWTVFFTFFVFFANFVFGCDFYMYRFNNLFCQSGRGADGGLSVNINPLSNVAGMAMWLFGTGPLAATSFLLAWPRTGESKMPNWAGMVYKTLLWAWCVLLPTAPYVLYEGYTGWVVYGGFASFHIVFCMAFAVYTCCTARRRVDA